MVEAPPREKVQMHSEEFLLGDISPPQVKHSVGVTCWLCLGLKFKPAHEGILAKSSQILAPLPPAGLKRCRETILQKDGKLLHPSGSRVMGREKELGWGCGKKGNFTAGCEVKLGLSQSKCHCHCSGFAPRSSSAGQWQSGAPQPFQLSVHPE